MGNENTPLSAETVDQLLWQHYVALIQDGKNGEEVLSGLTYDEAVGTVETLFQQSLVTPFTEKTLGEQVAYEQVTALHHKTFGEA